MTTTPAKLDTEAQGPRQALEEDIQALKRKIPSNQMMQRAAREAGMRGRRIAEAAGAQGGRLAAMAGRHSQRMARKVADQAKANPVPFVIGGAIAAAVCLIALGRRSARRDRPHIG